MTNDENQRNSRDDRELAPEIDLQQEAETETPDEEAADGEAEVQAVPSDSEAERAAELKERLLRTAADFDNYRKQTTARVARARRQEQDNVLCAFLPAIDNLERALAAHEGEENPWVEGMRGIHKQMQDALRAFGAARFEATEAEFDPQRHEAVARIPVPTKTESRVVEVIEPGYERDNGDVLRPAKVVVGYNPDSEDSSE